MGQRCAGILRHKLSDDETELEKLAGRVGKAQAYSLITAKVTEASYRSYPQLAPPGWTPAARAAVEA